MKQKSASRSTNRLFSIFLLFVILCSNLAGSGIRVVYAQDTPVAKEQLSEICMIRGTVQISLQESDAIKSAIANASSEVNFNGSECFAIIDLRDDDEWHLLTLVGLIGVQDDLKWTVFSNGAWSDLVLVHFSSTSVSAAIAGSQNFTALLEQVPTNIFSQDVKVALDPLIELIKFVCIRNLYFSI